MAIAVISPMRIKTVFGLLYLSFILRSFE
jgi:hypothetical protein